MIFVGAGQHITEAEKEAYYKDVSVQFNTKARVDNEFAMKWIQILKDYPGVRQAKLRRNAIICCFDNLGTQVREDKQPLKKYGVSAQYSPEGCTNLVQVFDVGVGSALEACMDRLLAA